MSPAQARVAADRLVVAIAAGNDPEAAHSHADRFIADVLLAIRDSKAVGPICQALATQALRVATAPGPRWTA